MTFFKPKLQFQTLMIYAALQNLVSSRFLPNTVQIINPEDDSKSRDDDSMSFIEDFLSNGNTLNPMNREFLSEDHDDLGNVENIAETTDRDIEENESNTGIIRSHENVFTESVEPSEYSTSFPVDARNKEVSYKHLTEAFDPGGNVGRENKMLLDDDTVHMSDDVIATDRQLFIPFSPVSQEFIEARYTSIIQKLPDLIDTARDVIIEDVATKNMIGYTFVFAYLVGAFLDSAGYILMFKDTLWQTIIGLVTDQQMVGWLMFWWWYAVAYGGPWMFPTTFAATGGVTDLRCSSSSFLQLINDHDLTLDIQSFTELSPGENVVLTSRLIRDFNLRLSCVVNKRGEHREAATVVQAFQSMLFLVSLHDELNTGDTPGPGPQARVYISPKKSRKLRILLEITQKFL